MSEQEEILRKEFGKLLSDDYCYLSHSFRVDGNLYSPASVMLEGRIEGDLFSEDNIFIEEGAVVNGNVSGKNVVVYGTVNGNISAMEKLGLHKNANVEGNIASKNCVIGGAVSLNGYVSVSKDLEIDTSFEYPVIKVKPPKVKTSVLNTYKKKVEKEKKAAEELVLPLYPEVKEKTGDGVIERQDVSISEKPAVPVEKESAESKKEETESKDKGKSRIDLLDSDHSLW